MCAYLKCAVLECVHVCSHVLVKMQVCVHMHVVFHDCKGSSTERAQDLRREGLQAGRI